MLDASEESFVVFDCEWRVLRCNRAAEAHLGLSREDAIGKVIWDLIPSRGGRLRSFLDQVMRSRQAAEGELPSDLRPGHSVAMRAIPIEAGIAVSFRDLTQQRERLRREREQADRLELALAAAGLGDWSWDMASDVITFSERAAEMAGILAGRQMTWTELQELQHPDDRARVLRAVEEAVAHRTSHEIAYRIIRPSDGEARWIMVRARSQYDELGAPTGMLGVMADITHVKAEEAQVRADRGRLAELERRRAFLLDVADRLGEEHNPQDIMSAASTLLGERLAVSRAGYAEITPDGDRLVVRGYWLEPGQKSLDGAVFKLNDFGPEIVAVLRRGEVLKVDDVAEDPRAAPFAASYAQAYAHALLAVPLIRGGRLEAFFYLVAAAPRTWSGEDIALAEDVAARTWSAVSRARVEGALRESEARFRAMADSAPAPIWVTSSAGTTDFVNRAFCEFAGKPREELLGDAWIGLLHPDDVAFALKTRVEGQRARITYGWTARYRRHGSEWRWMHVTSQPRFDASGAWEGNVGLAVDVTEARRAEERQRLLINELNHRVKNTLATVQSIVRQTLRDPTDSFEARERLNERLLALSAAHNVLTRQKWEAAEIGDIVDEAVAPYFDPSQPRISISGPPVLLPPNVALALSMALHELSTNAVKYGALSNPAGRVTLDWALMEGAVQLEWREHGGPPVHPPTNQGFGSRLLRRGLATELGAPAELLFEPAGLICRLRAPCALETR